MIPFPVRRAGRRIHGNLLAALTAPIQHAQVATIFRAEDLFSCDRNRRERGPVLDLLDCEVPREKCLVRLNYVKFITRIAHGGDFSLF